MKRICTLLARGGSEGVINKNIRELAGKPLIAHTILQAQKTGLFDRIAVSSDSDEILKAAGRWGVQDLVKRPSELATSTAPKLPAMHHCVLEVEKSAGLIFDVICDLDPTAPFRDLSDISECLRILEKEGVSNVLTAAPARKSPYFNLLELAENGVPKLSKADQYSVARRQDSPKCYDMNASIYVWKRDAFMKEPKLFYTDTRLYVMPRERSIEIDTEFDFEMARFFSMERGI